MSHLPHKNPKGGDHQYSQSVNCLPNSNIDGLIEQLREIRSGSDRYQSDVRLSSIGKPRSQESKLTKRRRNAIKSMEQLVLRRLSNCFNIWKLQVLLGSQSDQLERKLGGSPLKFADGDAKIQLDFSTFR